MFRQDRNAECTGLSLGGGILIAVKRELSALRVCAFENNKNESIWLKIKLPFSCLDVLVTYFSCNNPRVNYEFCSTSCLIPIVTKNRIFLHMTQLKDTRLMAVNNYMSALSLKSFNNVKNVKGRTLDLVLSNCSSVKVSCEGPLVTTDAHHPPFLVRIACGKTSPFINLNENFRKTLNLSKADFYSMYCDFRDANCSGMLNEKDVHEAVDSLYDNVFQVLKELALKIKSRKRVYPPWFNKLILADIRLKKKLERKRYNS